MVELRRSNFHALVAVVVGPVAVICVSDLLVLKLQCGWGRPRSRSGSGAACPVLPCTGDLVAVVPIRYPDQAC